MSRARGSTAVSVMPSPARVSPGGPGDWHRSAGTSTRRCDRGRPPRAVASRGGTSPGRRGSGARTGIPPAGGSGPAGGPRWRRSREWLGLAIRGIDLRSASVYGMAMLLKSTVVGARSTTLPAYMTMISSVRVATTPRSCVTRIMAMFRSRCSWESRSRICACTVTSRPVVGSSANNSRGRTGECDGDHDPLTHATGELGRVGLVALDG